MTQEIRTINLDIDPKKPPKKLDFMNTMATVLQVLDADPQAKIIKFKFKNGGTYELKLK